MEERKFNILFEIIEINYCNMTRIKFIVRIIEEDANNVATKILEITLPSKKEIAALFTPRLENIGFVKIDDKITVNLKNTLFRTYFNDWIIRFHEKLIKNNSIEELIFTFNSEIKSIILIGQKEKSISWQSARGLFGELLYIKELLIESRFSQKDIIKGWQRPSPARHDFDFQEYSLEIKTISRDNTTVKITSVSQLESFDNKQLNLRIYRIEKIEKSKEDSLGILFNEILEMLDQDYKMEFEIKCAEDKFCKYLGPQFTPIDYKFMVIENCLYHVDQKEFPRVKKNEINPAISKLSYSLDISSFDKFKI